MKLRLSIMLPRENYREMYSMKESGRINSNMDLEFRNGRLEPNMKENGFKVKLEDLGNFIISMVITMKDNGSMTRLMDKEYIFI